MSKFILSAEGIKPEDFKIFVGDMGIKKVYKGKELLYERKSSYCYIELDTKSTPEQLKSEKE
jgi:hypothetical protein